MTKLIIAKKLVIAPVLIVKIIQRLIIVSLCLKPVRERWRRKISVTAIATSETTANILTARDRLASLVSSAKVSRGTARIT